MAPKSAEAISERNAALLAIYLKCFKTKPEVNLSLSTQEGDC